jgi:hypothetical protein
LVSSGSRAAVNRIKDIETFHPVIMALRQKLENNEHEEQS